jgi:hypothetical protein
MSLSSVTYHHLRLLSVTDRGGSLAPAPCLDERAAAVAAAVAAAATMLLLLLLPADILLFDLLISRSSFCLFFERDNKKTKISYGFCFTSRRKWRNAQQQVALPKWLFS